MKKSTIIVVLIGIFLLYYFASPWNYKELEKLSIVTGMAFDVGKTYPYEMTLEVVDEGEKRAVFSAEGDSLEECVEKVALTVRQPLYFTHAKVLLMSDDFAMNALDEALDFVTKRDDIRLNILLVLTKKDSAYKILERESVNTAFQIAEYFQSKTAVMPEAAQSLYQFYSPYKSGERCFLPVLELADGEMEYKGVSYWN